MITCNYVFDGIPKDILDSTIKELELKYGVDARINLFQFLEKYVEVKNKADGIYKLLNETGKALGLSGCYCCGDTWNWKKHKEIPHKEDESMFPLCVECYDRLGVEDIIKYCQQLIDYWKLTLHNHDDKKYLDEIIKNEAEYIAEIRKFVEVDKGAKNGG